MQPNREVWRTLVLLGTALAASACSSSSSDPVAAGEEDDIFARGKVPAAWDRPITRPTEAAAAAARAGCRYSRGAMPAETLGAELPIGDQIPVKTIVVVMQENRSFDSYFGHLAKYLGRTDIESAPDNASNPERVDDPSGPRHGWEHGRDLCVSDTNHEWWGSHLQYDNGKNDGFYQSNHGFYEDGEPKVDPGLLDGTRAMWWYDERDIPFYYDLAGTFAIGDHYHAPVIGPTWPNRDYLYAGTSRGATTNVRPALRQPDFPANDAVIFDELERRRITWRIYTYGLPAPRVGAFLTPYQVATRWWGIHLGSSSSFFDNAREGKLEQVVFIDANVTENVDGNDEHPPSDIQNGQKFVSDVVHAMFASPQWKDSALFLTYDEHGGFYDHVPPPAACAPDEVAPDFKNAEDAKWPAKFDRYGFRVPITVVSPWSKPGYVSHHLYDHTSILRFIQAKFKLPALSNRDANAEAMHDFFDFSRPAFAIPPDIAAPTIDSARLATCQAYFPK